MIYWLIKYQFNVDILHLVDSLSRFSFRNTIYSYAHKSDLKEFSVSSFLGLGQRVPHATARLSQRRYVWPSRFFSRNKKEKSKVFTVFRLRSHKKCPWYWRELVSAKLVNKRDNVENKGGETQRINTNTIKTKSWQNVMALEYNPLSKQLSLEAAKAVIRILIHINIGAFKKRSS